MKIRISLAFCVILGTSFVSLGATDNPAQAAARAALEKRLYPPADPQVPLPATNPPTDITRQPSGTSTASATGTVPEKTATPKTAPAAIAPAPIPVTPAVITPAASSPAASSPAVVTPAAVVPATVVPATAVPSAPAVANHSSSSFIILLFVLMALLFLSLLIVSFLLLKLRALKLLLLQHPAIAARTAAAPRESRPVAAITTPKPSPAPVATRVVIPVVAEPAAAAAPARPSRATVATKRPAQRRKQVIPSDSAAGDIDLPKIEWAATKGERKRPSRAG